MIYGYVRVSTSSQTVENQKFVIENYAEANGLKIDKPLVVYNENGEYTEEILKIYNKK